MKIQKPKLVSFCSTCDAPAHKEEQALVLAEGLKEDKIMGEKSHLSDAVAMRIVASVMSRFNLTQTTEGE